MPDQPTGAVPTRVTEFQRMTRTHETSIVRAWARSRGLAVSTTGALPRFVYELYEARNTADQS